MSLEDIEKEYNRKYGGNPEKISSFMADPEEFKKRCFEKARVIGEHKEIILNFLNQKEPSFVEVYLCPYINFEEMTVKGKELKYLGYRITCAFQYNITALRSEEEKPILRVQTDNMSFGMDCPNWRECPLKNFVSKMVEKEIEEIPKRKRKDLDI